MNEGVEIAPEVASGSGVGDRGAGHQRRRGAHGAAGASGAGAAAREWIRGGEVVGSGNSGGANSEPEGVRATPLLLRAGRILDPSQGLERRGAVLIAEGRVRAIGPEAETEALAQLRRGA